MRIASQRSTLLAICGFICVYLIVPLRAQEPPKRAKGKTRRSFAQLTCP